MKWNRFALIEPDRHEQTHKQMETKTDRHDEAHIQTWTQTGKYG